MNRTKHTEGAELAALASPLDSGWKAALASFNNEDFDTTAIVRVFNALPPQADTLPNIAKIISAVYADTYWSLTFMDANHLANSLVKALGGSQSDALDAAQIAFGAWRGMLVRGDTGDDGSQMPRGVLTQSIDDVINGADPIDPTILFNRWNSPFFNQVDRLKNYCYTRAQSVNFNLPITKASARMFVTDQGFNQPPQSWLEMLTATDGSTSAPMMGLSLDPKQPLQPTDRAVSSDGYFFTPAESGHYCLLAVVSTEFFTNDPLSQSGNFNSQQWISSNGAAGWHNVDSLKSAAVSLKLYNQDPRSERFVVRAHCINVPIGTKVSLQGGGNALGVEPQSIHRPYQIIAAEGDLPANYAGHVTLRVDGPKRSPLPANAAIEVRAHWIVPPGHREYTKAVAQLGAYTASQNGSPLELAVGSVRFIGQ